MSRVVNLEVVEGSGTLGPGPALALKVVDDIADSAQTEACTTFHCPSVCSSVRPSQA